MSNRNEFEQRMSGPDGQMFKHYSVEVTEKGSFITCFWRSNTLNANVQCQILDGKVNLHCGKCGAPYPWKEAVDKAIEEFGEKIEVIATILSGGHSFSLAMSQADGIAEGKSVSEILERQAARAE